MNLKQIAYEDGYYKGEATGRAEFVLSMFNSGKTPETCSFSIFGGVKFVLLENFLRIFNFVLMCKRRC